MPGTGVNPWEDQKGYTGSNSHLQRQECAEGISRKQRKGGCQYDDGVI